MPVADVFIEGHVPFETLSGRWCGINSSHCLAESAAP